MTKEAISTGIEPPVDERSVMQKWEYLTLMINSNDAYSGGDQLYDASSGKVIGPDWPQALNSLGEKGWELVCSSPEKLIFKRPRE